MQDNYIAVTASDECRAKAKFRFVHCPADRTFRRGNSLVLKSLGKSPRLEGRPTTVPRVPVPARMLINADHVSHRKVNDPRGRELTCLLSLEGDSPELRTVHARPTTGE